MRTFFSKLISITLSLVLILASSFIDVAFAPTASAALNPAQNDYVLRIGRTVGSTLANYVYSTFMNPTGSGRYFSIKRIKINSIAIGAATSQDLDVRRISAVTAGTVIPTADIPKKNTSSSNSVADARYDIGTAGVTFVGATDSRIMSTVAAAATGVGYGFMEKNFDNNESLVLAPGEGIALYQTAVGSANQDISLALEWTETTVAPTAQSEYSVTYNRVANAAGVNYVYDSFFNPGSSGMVAIIKSIRAEVVAIGAAVYTNDIYLRKTSAASAGTQIAVANIPKKNSSSANSTMEVRYLGVTATPSGTTNSSYIRITPPGAANQTQTKEIKFGANDEKIVLKPGEGLALMSSAAGSANQVVKFTIEWQEISSGSAPASQGSYLYSFPTTAFAATANQVYDSFFNPSGSGRYATIKRITASAFASAGAVYNQISVRRITAASGGTAIPASDVTKKHIDTGNSNMQFNYANPTVTLFGSTADARIAGMTGPGAVGQRNGQIDTYLSDSESIVLAPGEGIALYTEAAGSASQRIIFGIEWTESASAPTSQGEYVTTIGSVGGSTVSGYNYASFFNPAASGKYTVIKRLGIEVDAVNTALYIPMTIRRITAASAGTQIIGANITEKNSTGATSVMDIRRTGVTVTPAGDANSRIMSVTTPGAVSSAVSQQLSGFYEQRYSPDEFIVLAPGEGIVLYQEAAGDVDFRVRMDVEWAETATNPQYQGEFSFSSGPLTGSTVSGYNYASFFNPAASGHVFIVNKLGLSAVRVGAVTSPTLINTSLRRTTAASGGTLITAANIPEKNSSTTASIAEIRVANPTITFFGSTATSTRIMGLSSPSVVGEMNSRHESIMPFGNEIILLPGEGITLYQEAAPGDANVRFFLNVGWSEMTVTQSAYRFFTNTNSTSVGAPLALQDTAATLSAAGVAFRLRLALDLEGADLLQNQDSFKLQFAPKSGTCDTAFVGESYVDVTTGTTIAWNDNATPLDGAQAVGTSTDPQSGTKTRIYETYDEANPFTNASSTSIYPKQSGVWDFSLKDNGAPVSSSYCFRAVRNNGSTLESYSVIPEIITAPAPNVLPVASGILINGGAGTIILTEGTTTPVTCTGTVTDNNGFADIQSVTADLYRTSLGTSSALDINNHYRLSGNSQCIPSGGSGSSQTYTCGFNVWYHADPTDVGSPNAADTWTCMMTPVDTVATGTVATTTAEMASLYAISVTPSISYGTLVPGANTGAINSTTTVTNTGNIATNLALSGADMTSGADTIAVGSQKYASTTFTYLTGGVALSTTPTTLVLGLAKKTVSTTTAPIYWGIGVPNGSRIGSYSGSVTFTAGP